MTEGLGGKKVRVSDHGLGQKEQKREKNSNQTRILGKQNG